LNSEKEEKKRLKKSDLNHSKLIAPSFKAVQVCAWENEVTDKLCCSLRGKTLVRFELENFYPNQVVKITRSQKESESHKLIFNVSNENLSLGELIIELLHDSLPVEFCAKKIVELFAKESWIALQLQLECLHQDYSI